MSQAFSKVKQVIERLSNDSFSRIFPKHDTAIMDGKHMWHDMIRIKVEIALYFDKSHWEILCSVHSNLARSIWYETL